MCLLLQNLQDLCKKGGPEDHERLEDHRCQEETIRMQVHLSCHIPVRNIPGLCGCQCRDREGDRLGKEV